MPKFSPGRSAIVFVAVACALVALIGRVTYLQTTGRQHTIRRAERQQHVTEVLPARRGNITDCNGQILATTIQSQTLFVDPQFLCDELAEDCQTLNDIKPDIEKLANLIDKDPKELTKLLTNKSESRFVRLAEKLDDKTVAAIRDLNLPGIGFQPLSVRNYPMASLASHILGGVGFASTGLEGVEMKFDKILAGKDGYKRTLKDARRRGIEVAADDYFPPIHGHHLVLTIDSTIQMIGEEEMAKVCEKFQAKRAELVIMNCQTGQVLALANWPTFNPQNLEDSKPEVRRNRALTDPYEPGSTIKPFIVGPALEWNITHPTEIFNVGSPYITPYGRHVADVHEYGKLALWDVLVKSSNIGMCKLGERMTNPSLYKALKTFNFGQRTGIELPGEDPGLVYPLRKWTKFSTESVSQGYEVMITPLQLARAFCAYANGGHLVQPHIIKGLLDDTGHLLTPLSPSPGTPGEGRGEGQFSTLDGVRLPRHLPVYQTPEILDPQTAALVRQILTDVPVRGTAAGTRVLCPDYNYFGKTGTAHISNGKGGYSDEKYTSSFVAAAPAENPQIVVALVVHEVKKNGKNYYGGFVSAPAVASIFERTLTYLQVPQSPDLIPPPPQIADCLWNFNANAYKRPHQQTALAN